MTVRDGTVKTGVRTGLLRTHSEEESGLPGVCIRVVSGPDRGTQAVLDEGTFTIGSHPDADLVLRDPTVSRFHLELALLPGGVRVRDLKSTNGSFVGASRIESAVLSPTAEVRVGRTRIELLPLHVPAPDTPSSSTRFGKLCGASAAMRRIFGALERAAPSDAPVLIEGESGVGKSEAARGLHDASARRAHAFAVADLGARMSVSPLQTAEAATGGTIVFDRIDEAPAAATEEVIRVLRMRETGKLDVRPIAISRVDLRERVQEGGLPRDLYFHLAAVRVVIPPLRDRREDIPMLVRDLLDGYGYGDVQLTSRELTPLTSQTFEGNVRELARLIEQTLVAGMNGSTLGLMPRELEQRSTIELARKPFKQAKEDLVQAFEREYVGQLLERHAGNLSRAAQEAGLDRNYLARLAKKHGLR